MKTYSLLMAYLALFLFPLVAYPAVPSDIGSVVALKGKATIDRATQHIDAHVKSGIQPVDLVKTQQNSRLKILFNDDSVLTLGDSSQMSVKEFVHSKGERGKSLFNLIDGKMRAVVGKTKFEVRTPTAVAAARGTVIYFETGELDGRNYTEIICLEGIVDVFSVMAAGGPGIQLTPGTMVLVKEGQPLPKPTPATQIDMDKVKKNTSIAGSEVKLMAPVLPGGLTTGTLIVDTPVIIPLIDQQQPHDGGVGPKQPTTVVIGVNF